MGNAHAAGTAHAEPVDIEMLEDGLDVATLAVG
jgi:hypothetical protein